MKDYIYEVRFPNNPVKDYSQKFNTKQEAMNFAENDPTSEVYMLELEYPEEFGFDGPARLVNMIQLKGPDMDANLSDETVPNSCEGDATSDACFTMDDFDEDVEFSADRPVDDQDDWTDEKFLEELAAALSEKKCKKYKVITHSDDEDVDCLMTKPPLEKPLTEQK